MEKDQERRAAYIAREQAIEKATDAKKNQRKELHGSEEAERQTREQNRRNAYLATERANEEASQCPKK